MHARIQAARKNESGFTLIELLIVIVILGVLAGIVVFSVAGITDKGDTAACKANLKTVQVASEAYYAQAGSYATAINGSAATTLVGGGFLQSAPPTTGVTSVTYAVTAPAKPTITGGSACTP